MNRAETEDGSYASARNRKLLAEWAAKAGENEYAEPALSSCQITAYAFFTGDPLVRVNVADGELYRDLRGFEECLRLTAKELLTAAAPVSNRREDRA